MDDEPMPAYCYLLTCADGSYYCGWTFDLEKRVKAHQAGNGSRYTRSHLPVELAYYEKCENRSSAMRREKQLKRKSHAAKKALATGFDQSHE